MGKPLTTRERLFCKEYLVDKNGTRAVLKAGYPQTEAAAAVTACRLLKIPKIAAEIEGGLKLLEEEALERARARGITKEKWLKEIERIAFSDMDDFATIADDGTLVLVKSAERKPGKSRVIKKISQSKSSSTNQFGGAESLTQSLELHDKVKALAMVGDHFGWLKQKLELTGKDGEELQGPQIIVTVPSNGREAKN